LALDGGQWSASHPSYFTPGKTAPIPTGEEGWWALSWSGYDGKVKNPCLCARNQTTTEMVHLILT